MNELKRLTYQQRKYSVFDFLNIGGVFQTFLITWSHQFKSYNKIAEGCQFHALASLRISEG